MDPNQMMKQEISPAKMNSELAMNFFGDELMPGGPDMMAPPPGQMMPGQVMGPPLAPPVLSSPVSHPVMMPPQAGGKPAYNIQIKQRSKPPQSPLLDPLQNKKYV